MDPVRDRRRRALRRRSRRRPRSLPRQRRRAERAAEQQNYRAVLELGFMYEASAGVKQNLNTAYQYYEHAARLGDSTAALMTGHRYKNDITENESKEKSFYFFQKALI